MLYCMIQAIPYIIASTNRDFQLNLRDNLPKSMHRAYCEAEHRIWLTNSKHRPSTEKLPTYPRLYKATHYPAQFHPMLRPLLHVFMHCVLLRLTGDGACDARELVHCIGSLHSRRTEFPSLFFLSLSNEFRINCDTTSDCAREFKINARVIMPMRRVPKIPTLQESNVQVGNFQLFQCYGSLAERD